MRRALIVLVLGLVMALAGCGNDDGNGNGGTADRTVEDDSSETTAPGDDSLPMQPPQGSYELTALEVDGEEFEPVAGSTVRLEFAEGQVTVGGGCNTLFADQAFDGTAVTIREFGGTAKGCDQQLMEQDERLMTVLPGRWKVVGSELLVLSGDGKEMELTPIVETDQPLAGTTWKLTSILDGDTASSAPQGVTATVTFDEEGTIGVMDGCNTGGGDVEIADSTLTIGQLMSTQMACSEPGKQRTQAAYSQVLQGTVEYTIDGDTLTLTKGNAGLEFTSR